MRSGMDRLRHTLLFEAFALVISVPAASFMMHKDMAHTGILAVGLSLSAMVWNLSYNYVFDRVLVRLNRPLNRRPPALRVFHAVLFEAGLMALTLPAVAWWMDLSLWHAFLMDLGFASFFVVYAFCYNWAYDRIFPYPVQVSASLTTIA